MTDEIGSILEPVPIDRERELAHPRPCIGAVKRVAALTSRKTLLSQQHLKTSERLKQVRAYLDIHGKVTQALEQLNQQLFQELLRVIEDKLTIALQEVLDQPIQLKAEATWKRNAASVSFWVERGGQAEDIMKGQGGSVANILSVGLRMFALTTLDPREHRRFLVLDEQDCWIRPDLVPRLVKIVHDAGEALGFQTLMISHHDVAIFSEYADKIYEIEPSGAGGVTARLWTQKPMQPDEDARD